MLQGLLSGLILFTSFSARTPNRSIPPPNPIIDEIKEDTKLVKIIDIMESIEILSG